MRGRRPGCSAEASRRAQARLGVLGLALVMSLAACDDTQVVCEAGELRYSGRPPRELFAQDESCRDDCFSLPSGVCDASCPDVATVPTGAIVGGRTLILADDDSPGDERALAFVFGYEDEAGGTAPDTWSFFLAGPQTYLADQIDSTARFVMGAGVYSTATNTTLGAEYASATADPGRLEVRRMDAERIAGRFFLSYSSATDRPNAQVNGCFDLSVAAADAAGVQRLGL